jgi:hypothetical protein
MSEQAAYIVVLIFDQQIIPVGKIYYDLNEAREQKSKHQAYQLPTIIKMASGKPPMVEMT